MYDWCACHQHSSLQEDVNSHLGWLQCVGHVQCGLGHVADKTLTLWRLSRVLRKLRLALAVVQSECTALALGEPGQPAALTCA